MAEKEKNQPNQTSKDGSHQDNPEQAFSVDITEKAYKQIKEQTLRQVPRVGRTFVNQYFGFLKGLKVDEVLDWMEGKDSIRDLWEKAPYPIRVALAPARGIIKVSKRIRNGANKAINWQVAALTLRFENPSCWEVIKAYGEEGIQKLKDGAEDFKIILKVKEAPVGD